jgi:hypothetical protein
MDASSVRVRSLFAMFVLLARFALLAQSIVVLVNSEAPRYIGASVLLLFESLATVSLALFVGKLRAALRAEYYIDFVLSRLAMATVVQNFNITVMTCFLSEPPLVVPMVFIESAIFHVTLTLAFDIVMQRSRGSSIKEKLSDRELSTEGGGGGGDNGIVPD